MTKKITLSSVLVLIFILSLTCCKNDQTKQSIVKEELSIKEEQKIQNFTPYKKEILKRLDVTEEVADSLIQIMNEFQKEIKNNNVEQKTRMYIQLRKRRNNRLKNYLNNKELVSFLEIKPN